MAYKTNCYVVRRSYNLNKEKVKKAFEIILSVNQIESNINKEVKDE